MQESGTGTVFRIRSFLNTTASLSSFRSIALFLVLTAILGSCASQKSRESRSAFNRFYHNETAYYNGYFNANVLFEQSKARLAATHQDNYIRVLEVYDYVNVPSPEVVNADVDKAIEKLSVVVALHKHSVWTDDSYLLVGKSQYLKHDYESAEETLEYLREVYSPEAMAQRKNKAGRKARAKAKDKERAAKKKKVEKERAVKKKAAEKVRKDKQKEAASKAKERRKEAQRKQKERQKEAKARAKARKKGQKVPARKRAPDASDPTQSGDQTLQDPTPDPEPLELPAEEPAAEEVTVGDEELELPAPPKREKYFLKHRPAYADGLLWLGRTYTERQLYDDAMRAFSQAAEQPSASDKVLREVPVAQAHLFLKQERYEDAVPYLHLAIARANKRKLKARYYYVLGQIQQRQGRLVEASESFRKVRKMRPGYEMDFNARLNLTLSSWMAGRANPSETRRDLEKMLKDKKNTEFKDRLYFALAEIDLYEKDTAQALVHLTESLGYNPSNKAQRAETQLKLADLYYAQERYIEAKTFYEQCLENLLVTDDRYPRASRLSRNLTEIARNLKVIQLQDSLLRIAGMSEKERIALAEDIKAQRVAKAQAARQEQSAGKGAGQAQAQQVGLNAPQARGAAPAGTTKSTFFAYDSKALERGLKDFRKAWGDRPLTDKWRLSSRNVSFAVEDVADAEEAIETRLTKSELQEMFKDVPFEEEAAQAAREKIEDAMLSLGRLYRERLEYPEKTIEVLNEFLVRFPASEHELDAWYFLYLAHAELQQKAEARRYYDLITGKYPESTYARVLTDPSYLGEAEEKERKLNQYYQTTFDMFQSGKYSAVWKRLSEVDTLFGRNNRLQTKFALLKAMTTGNIEGKDAYIDALKDLVAKFPNTEEEKRAKEILRLLGDKSVAPKALPGQVEPDSEFALDPEGVHYVIINWNLSDVGLEDAQKAVNNFNNTYFKADRLRLSANIFLNVDVPLMVIRKFDSAEKAMEFYRMTEKYPDQFIGKAGAPARVYPVTQQNYRVVLKNRSLEAYDTYFRTHYR
jgi:tetratricopeptide (TPR) repeat protein